jgi:hypothetical protein
VLTGNSADGREVTLNAFGRTLLAVLLAALLLSACTDKGATDGGEGATAQPTASPTVQATTEPSSTPSPTSPSPSTSSTPTAGRLCETKVESANPVLRSVRFGRHATYDRLAFDFCKPAETTLTAKVVKQLTEDGSGKTVTLKGAHFIAITLTPADAHSNAGQPTVPDQAVTVAGRNIQQYKLIGDFEGVVSYGVGFLRIEPTATAIRSDPIDPRHLILYFDLGPQTG